MTDWLSPDEWRAVALSLRVSLWATALSLPLGIFTAHLLARRNFWGKQLLNGLVHLPLILPPVVTGYLLLLAFGRKGVIGQYLDQWFGVTLAFKWTGAVLAAAVMAFPLMVRAIRLALEAVDPKLEQAAATLGASPLWVFLTVTLPLILPSVFAGALLSFTLSVDEFIIAYFTAGAGQSSTTLPMQIYAMFRFGVTPEINAMATIVMLVSFVALLLAQRLNKGKVPGM